MEKAKIDTEKESIPVEPEMPPFAKSWNRMYWIVGLTLAGLILLFYGIKLYFE